MARRRGSGIGTLHFSVFVRLRRRLTESFFCLARAWNGDCEQLAQSSCMSCIRPLTGIKAGRTRSSFVRRPFLEEAGHVSHRKVLFYHARFVLSS